MRQVKMVYAQKCNGENHFAKMLLKLEEKPNILPVAIFTLTIMWYSRILIDAKRKHNADGILQSLISDPFPFHSIISKLYFLKILFCMSHTNPSSRSLTRTSYTVLSCCYHMDKNAFFVHSQSFKWLYQCWKQLSDSLFFPWLPTPPPPST